MATSGASTTSGGLVEFRSAGKQFGGDWAVRDLSLLVEPGSIVGLIGPSGCGKTTTVRLVNGTYRPDEGEVSLFGAPSASLGNAERTRIGYLPQRPVLFQHLSLRENLNFLASLQGVRLRRRARLREVLELVDLLGHEHKQVREASGGMQRRLALAATLVHAPSLVLLDEPTAGIDPILRQRFWDHFRALRDLGRTLLVTTQYVGEATRCDTVGLIAEGRLVALGPPDHLRRQAFGGELLDIDLDRMPSDRMIDDLQRLGGVVTVEQVARRQLRLTVDDAGARLPAVVSTIDATDAAVVHTAEVTPDFDDVFIRLVDDASDAAAAADAPAMAESAEATVVAP